MSNVVVFIPRHENDGAKNLEEFINYAKNELTLFEEQGGFEVDEWKFFKKKKFTVVFSQLKIEKKGKGNNYQHEYFEEPYLSFAKAYTFLVTASSVQMCIFIIPAAIGKLILMACTSITIHTLQYRLRRASCILRKSHIISTM